MMNSKDTFHFRICKDEQGYYILEKKGFFRMWKDLHDPFSLSLKYFPTYHDAVMWIEHETSRRIGIIIENCTYE